MRNQKKPNPRQTTFRKSFPRHRLARHVTACRRMMKVHPAGFEPATFGSEDRVPVIANVLDHNDLEQSENCGYRDGYRSVCQRLSRLDVTCLSELMQLIHSWGELSVNSKQTILTIVKADKGG